MKAADPSTGRMGWTFEQGGWKPYVAAIPVRNRQ
jgi:hypothetical protein